MKAELNLRHLARIARILTPPAALASWGPPRLGLSVNGDQLTVATTTRDLAAQAHTRGGMADGHTSVAAADLRAALTAVAPTGRGAGKAVVRLHTEPGQLHLTAASAAVIPTTDPGPAPTLPDGAAPVLTVPIRTWLDTLAAAVIAADPSAGPRQGTDALRLWRDPGCCLVVDATDTYRVHRSVLGEPEPDRHESWLPAVTARAGMRMLALAHDSAPMRVAATDTHLIWDAGTVQISTALVQRSACPWLEQVHETVTDADLTFTADLATLTDAMRRAVAVAGPTAAVELIVAADTTTLTVAVPGTAESPPRLSQTVPITAVRGLALHTRVRAGHALQLFVVAGAGEARVQVNTDGNLIGVTRGRFTGVIVHSNAAGAGTSPRATSRTEER